jgi:hypothetical protein
MNRSFERGLVAVAFLALAGIFAAMVYRCGGSPVGRHWEPVNIHYVSTAIIMYEQEHGDLHFKGECNREVAAALLADDRLRSGQVTGGLVVDSWGTPYAIFLCDSEPGKFTDTEAEVAGQTVRPEQGIGKEWNQIISAGPDRTFGTRDDLGSWQTEPLGYSP